MWLGPMKTIEERLSRLWRRDVVAPKGRVRYDYNIFKDGDLVGACVYDRVEGLNLDALGQVVADRRKLEHLYYMKVFLDIHTALIVEFDDAMIRLDIDLRAWGDFPRFFPYAGTHNSTGCCDIMISEFKIMERRDAN